MLLYSCTHGNSERQRVKLTTERVFRAKRVWVRADLNVADAVVCSEVDGPPTVLGRRSIRDAVVTEVVSRGRCIGVVVVVVCPLINQLVQCNVLCAH